MLKKAAVILGAAVLLTACTANKPKTEESSKQLSKMNTGDYQEKLRTDVSSPPAGKNDYFFWGKVALAETKKKYNSDQVKDYTYDGRTVNQDGSVIDSFNFNVMKNGTKHIVKTSILHEPDSRKVTDIMFEEQG
ncbi:DUF3889 domain-containing protein [Fictibacillus aquaticus]|uniref:DUF3889 domain-containing protein n=1 Tax=Fictibacillus aquaticus TaxID=2021314 RepID=A0A235F7U9_9BACL|nr:DUF3889 domain-containing protein [Fictibacillus aquaticus]OYD57431.1 hypothetical protein CGZ90_12195 [Fictibacillus aquaticus]